MHTPSLMAMLVILVLAFLLFGKPGRLSGMMEDIGKGIKGFRKGLTDTEPSKPAEPEEPPRMIADKSGVSTPSSQSEKSGR